jgi:hypothetical protein
MGPHLPGMMKKNPGEGYECNVVKAALLPTLETALAQSST